ERGHESTQDRRLETAEALVAAVSLEHGARPVRRGVREHERAVPERDLEAERPEDGRRCGERVERAEPVVHETRLDQLARPDGAPGSSSASTTCTVRPA